MRPETSSELARFQSGFAAALRGDEPIDDPALAALAAHPAFAVYRNGVAKHAIDALAGNFPAVLRLVGEDWFRGAAGEFVRRCPPRLPMLIEYGDGFPDFLAAFPPAADLPYLSAVARLDRLWTQSHIAASAEPLDASALTGLDPDTLAATRLVPHPAMRCCWFDDVPAFSLWSRNRAAAACDGELDWVGEGALLVRPGPAVTWQRIDRASCAFLDACSKGEPLDRAAGAALSADPAADLGSMLQTLLLAGAFGTAEYHSPGSGENR